jgi:phage shock protein A
MGILGRLSRSIKSNLNSMIDKAEDPAKIINQTIDDMQDELKKARQEVVTALASEKQLEKKAADQVKDSEGWERKAMLALEHGDEELAREAIKRKKKAEGDAVETDRLRGQQATYVSDLRSSIEQLERKVEELKARKGTLAAQVSRARTPNTADPLGAASSSAGPASPALGRLKEMQDRIDQMEAQVEAHNILDDPKRAEIDEKFRKLERGETTDAVDDELAALKRRLKNK